MWKLLDRSPRSRPLSRLKLQRFILVSLPWQSFRKLGACAPVTVRGVAIARGRWVHGSGLSARTRLTVKLSQTASTDSDRETIGANNYTGTLTYTRPFYFALWIVCIIAIIIVPKVSSSFTRQCQQYSVNVFCCFELCNVTLAYLSGRWRSTPPTFHIIAASYLEIKRRRRRGVGAKLVLSNAVMTTVGIAGTGQGKQRTNCGRFHHAYRHLTSHIHTRILDIWALTRTELLQRKGFMHLCNYWLCNIVILYS